MIRIVIALVLFAHALGHSLGPLQVFKVAAVNPQWQGSSWLLGGLGQFATNTIGTILWLVALFGFVAAAGVVIDWLPAEWWSVLAIGASLASLIGIGLFPTAFPTVSTIGAAVIDVIVLLAVAWQHWTPAALAE